MTKTTDKEKSSTVEVYKRSKEIRKLESANAGRRRANLNLLSGISNFFFEIGYFFGLSGKQDKQLKKTNTLVGALALLGIVTLLTACWYLSSHWQENSKLGLKERQDLLREKIDAGASQASPVVPVAGQLVVGTQGAETESEPPKVAQPISDTVNSVKSLFGQFSANK